MKKKVLFILISGLIFTSYQLKDENIVRFNEFSISKEIHAEVPIIIDFKDTLSNDTLVEYLSEEQIPVMYSRKFLTGVCIDGKCRMLNIELFWNITGRYLGFKLPEGEFLSKTEHVKFNSNEYDMLNHLLANPLSELANYSLKELVPEEDTTKYKVDAVSSATIAAVLDYIVPGAVYTTYTLWHYVYGPTKQEIEKITSERLSTEIALELLNSQNKDDQIWTLNHISGKVEISVSLQSKLMEIISGNDIYLAEQSLHTLKPENLTSEIQIELINIFIKVGFLQKRLIIQKLEDSSNLDNYVIKKFSSELNGLNGVLVKTILEMFTIHNVEDEMVTENVSELLKDDNRYIAKQAFKYLDNIDNPDKKTVRDIEK
ncbi:MAG: hypothetical protein HUJ25_06620 [Crocinitomicaceae bacterium]|nr:hypothetical protein [Crocinitomicaceae bacterium]